MQQTETYKLNLIEGSDAFSPQPMNDNMEAIEGALEALAGGQLHIAAGSYTGTGAYGEDSPNTLTLGFQPKFLMIWCLTDLYHAVGIQGQSLRSVIGESVLGCSTTWGADGVSWYYSPYSGDGSGVQMNTSNAVYQYLVLG